MTHLLLVEDDPILAEGLKLRLELEGYKIFWAQSLKQAFELNEKETLNLVLLDLGLPDGSGFEFCLKLREQGSRLPVIILTAQADEDSVVEGFRVGANDYVKKPFSQKELLARIKASLREPILRDNQIRYGQILLLVDQRRVYVGEEELILNRREFDLLKILIEQPGAVVTREMMISKLDSAEDIFD
ncbi:MAG: response regulator transcription factor, partial [Bdellovibrionota bacterium]